MLYFPPYQLTTQAVIASDGFITFVYFIYLDPDFIAHNFTERQIGFNGVSSNSDATFTHWDNLLLFEENINDVNIFRVEGVFEL